jgi:hypothetical protein
MKLYMFQTVPLSIIRNFSLYTQQWYMSYRFTDSLRAGSGWYCSSILIQLSSCQQNSMTYIIAVCTVKSCWWWTEELSETCIISFQVQIWEISASSWFYYMLYIKYLTLLQPNFADYLYMSIRKKHAFWIYSLWSMIRALIKYSYITYSANKCTVTNG